MADVKGAKKTNMFLVEPEELILVTDKEHVLYDERVNNEVIESLVLNIMAHGVLEPIIVRRAGDKLEVVDGRHRVKAAIEANNRFRADGRKTLRVPCVIKVGKDGDMYGILISTNEHRKDDGPLERAIKVKKYLDMGYTKKEAAVNFGVTEKSINEWLGLFKLAPMLWKAIEDGRLSATAAVPLCSLSHEEQEKAYNEAGQGVAGRVTGKNTKKVKAGGKADSSTRMMSKAKVELRLNETVADNKSPWLPRPSTAGASSWASGYQAALEWVLRMGDEDEN